MSIGLDIAKLRIRNALKWYTPRDWFPGKENPHEDWPMELKHTPDGGHKLEVTFPPEMLKIWSATNERACAEVCLNLREAVEGLRIELPEEE